MSESEVEFTHISSRFTWHWGYDGDGRQTLCTYKMHSIFTYVHLHLSQLQRHNDKMGNLISKVTQRLAKLARSESRSRSRSRPERLPRTPTISNSKATRDQNRSSFSTKRPPQVYRYGCPPVPPSTPVSLPRDASENEDKDEDKDAVVVEIEDTVPALPRTPPSSAPEPDHPVDGTNPTPVNDGIASAPASEREEVPSLPLSSTSPSSIKTTKTARLLFTPVQPLIEKAPAPHTISTTTLTTEFKTSVKNAAAAESKDAPSTPESINSDDLPPMRRIESYLSLASSVSTFADERQQRWSRIY